MKKAKHGPTQIWPDDLKGIVERWMKEVWQRGNVDAIDTLHAPHFLDHSPAGRAADNVGFKAGVRDLYRGFPDFSAVIDDLIIHAESGKVAVRWRGAGTHYGEFLGAQATDKQITFRGIEMLRIEHGLIVERWGEWDGIDLLRQLGLLNA
jgi:steroid delta-isomerase-like uncharacterized protein